MPDTPYQSSNAAPPAPKKTRPTGWLIWSGVTSLVLAAVCFSITVIGMMMAFNTLLLGESSTVAPEDLAQSIGLSLILTIAAVPLGMLGLALVVTGLLVRQPGD